MTPAKMWLRIWEWAGTVGCLTIVGLLLIGGLVLGCWQAGWWFTNHNVGRTNQLIQNGYANQNALRSQISNDVSTVRTITVQMDGATGQQLADLTAQRLASADDACNAASQISKSYLLGDLASWVQSNCSDGSVSLGSSLRK